MSETTRKWSVWRVAAAVLLAAAGLLVVWNVDNSFGTHCGSWVSPNTAAAGYADAKANSAASQANLEEALLGSGGDLNASLGSSARDTSTTAQVDSCAQARSARTPVIVVTAVAGFAALGFSITRRT